MERRFREMTHAGAGLDEDAKAQLTELNQRLSTLTTTFEKNLLTDTNDLAVVFDHAAELDGLTDGELSATAQAATDRGLDGKFVVTLTLFTGHPYLASLTRARRRASASWMPRDRAASAATRTTTAMCCGRSSACAQSAPPYWGTTRTRHTSPRTRLQAPPAQSHDLLRRLAGPAARNAAREQEALQAIIDGEPDSSSRSARLGVLHREGEGRRVRPRSRRAASLVRGGARPAGRRLLCGPCPLRGVVRRARRSRRRITPRRACSRCETKTAANSGSSSSTCTRATPSAAARG